MIVYIILNYKNFAVTKKCVDSLLEFGGEDSRIVVVDNFSQNDSLEKLHMSYDACERVTVIASEENGGYSKGNNIGCEYALKTFENVEFLCVFNNDTYIDDPLFAKKIYASYAKTNFDILGPNIWYIAKSRNQNPFSAPKDLKEVKRSIKQVKRGMRLYKVSSVLDRIYSRYFRKRETGVIMHGAAIIFSKNYFSRYEKIFPEVTFLYGEESFIYYRKQTDDLRLVFDFDLKVYHINDASTDNDRESKCRANNFRAACCIKYLEKLKEIYEKGLKI